MNSQERARAWATYIDLRDWCKRAGIEQHVTWDTAVERGHWIDDCHRLKRTFRHVTAHPHFYSGAACCAWRLPCYMFASMFAGGMTIEEMCDEYPATPEQVMEAIRFCLLPKREKEYVVGGPLDRDDYLVYIGDVCGVT